MRTTGTLLFASTFLGKHNYVLRLNGVSAVVSQTTMGDVQTLLC